MKQSLHKNIPIFGILMLFFCSINFYSMDDNPLKKPRTDTPLEELFEAKTSLIILPKLVIKIDEHDIAWPLDFDALARRKSELNKSAAIPHINKHLSYP